MNFASLYSPAHDFLRRNAGQELLIVAMERNAVDQIVRELGGSHAGIHRYSLRQLTMNLAARVLAQREKRPITRLAAEGLPAQVIDRVSMRNPQGPEPQNARCLLEARQRPSTGRQHQVPTSLRLESTFFHSFICAARVESQFAVR